MIAVARSKRQHGTTLLELLVAMSLGMLLTAMVLQVFASSKQTYRITDALAQLQNNGRYALDMLTYDVRMAGYLGCADLNTIEPNIIANNSPTSDYFATALRGYEVDSTAWPPSDLSAIENDVKPGSDVLVVQLADGGVDISGDSGSAILAAANPDNLGAGDVAVVSSCSAADIFQVTSVSGTTTLSFAHASTGNSAATLSTSYASGSKNLLMRFVSRAYFVADTGRTNSAGDAIHALHRRDVDGSVVELIEGVENMQVLYGELNSATDTIRYVPADNSTLDMSDVVGVRIGLLMTSTDRVTDVEDSRTYRVAGTDIGTSGSVSHAQDRRLRRVFTTTIHLRNRDNR